MATVFDSSQVSILATVGGVTFPQSLQGPATSTTIEGRKLTAVVDSIHAVTTATQMRMSLTT